MLLIDYLAKVETSKWCVVELLDAYEGSLNSASLSDICARIEHDLDEHKAKRRSRKADEAVHAIKTKINVLRSLKCLKSVRKKALPQESSAGASVNNFAKSVKQSVKQNNFFGPTIPEKRRIDGIDGREMHHKTADTPITAQPVKRYRGVPSTADDEYNEANSSAQIQGESSTSPSTGKSASDNNRQTSTSPSSASHHSEIDENTDNYAEWLVQYGTMTLKQ
ncbi:hypothetical protein BDB00DRAFT_877737 [Zychaea mexicana]|uniref:uncharacterized protein n=1 Tax=Zychaea mexicana TaxID=64656 RepID=UPI0022FDD090|nr:uncharacterized protein BDB00DRAFT_877737 [Zychaea mexicana]KAI9488186.1 hypothetical protein BDB00DRAFT_877737 [Zychaea mexicana]